MAWFFINNSAVYLLINFLILLLIHLLNKLLMFTILRVRKGNTQMKHQKDTTSITDHVPIKYSDHDGMKYSE